MVDRGRARVLFASQLSLNPTFSRKRRWCADLPPIQRTCEGRSYPKTCDLPGWPWPWRVRLGTSTEPPTSDVTHVAGVNGVCDAVSMPGHSPPPTCIHPFAIVWTRSATPFFAGSTSFYVCPRTPWVSQRASESRGGVVALGSHLKV